MAMADQMSQLPQPCVTASWVRDFGSFDASHAWAVNFVVVAYCSESASASCRRDL